MADITGQAEVVFQDGRCGHTTLYALRNANAGDTIDVSGQFRVVKRVGLVSDTGTTIAAATIAGTVLTIPGGPSGDGVWLLVVGVAV